MIRSKEEFIQNLKDERNIIFQGEYVKDITIHPYFSKIINKVGNLYDMQKQKEYQSILSVYDSELNETISRSYYLPKNQSDLKLQREAFNLWAKETHGFMGRTPDYMNSFIMSMSYSNNFFSEEGNNLFAQNIKNYHIYAAKNNLYLSHAFASVQFNKSKSLSNTKSIHRNPTLKIISKNEKGIIVSGSRTSVTLAPISDELIVFGAGQMLKKGEEYYAISFATAIATKGLSFICREALFSNEEHGTPFVDEIDCIAIFDKVLIPWEKVFILDNININNNFKKETLFLNHLGRQVLMRLVNNLELISGLASKGANALGIDTYINVKEDLGKIIHAKNIIESCLIASEAKATVDKTGILIPDKESILTGLIYSQQVYSDLIQILREISASSLINIPSISDINKINEVLATHSLSGINRTNLFRLIYFVTIHSFSGRSLLYERFWIGASIRSLSRYWEESETTRAENAVEFALKNMKKDKYE